AGIRDAVVLAATALGLVAPVGLDEAVFLEAPVGGVQCGLLDLVLSSGGGADRLVDLEAVNVAATQHAEHDRVGVAAGEVSGEGVTLPLGVRRGGNTVHHSKYYNR